MSRFGADARVLFRPFTRQIEGSEVVIGRPQANVFLSLPLEALEVLDRLAEGRTIAEAQQDYHRKYGETPDVGSLLEYLEEKGFLIPPDGEEEEGLPAASSQVRFHFSNIPESFARKVFSRFALTVASFFIFLAVLAATAEPSLRPSWRFLFFEQNVTLMALFVMMAGLGVTFVHEMAHLVAARSRGVSCRLGISHRLWVLVAETDMTGVWALPRRQRYLPILAGPLVDAVSGSLIVVILFAHRQGWVPLPLPAERFLQAMVMVYILNVLWQCYFFVRTDFYFAYTTAFGCKNLMKDTKDFLRNRVAALWPRLQPVDQSHIPSREMSAIATYSVFWLIGRVVAFAVLVTIILPLMWHYFVEIAQRLFSTEEIGNYNFIDAVVFSSISLTILLAGFWLWVRSLFREGRWRSAMAHGDT